MKKIKLQFILFLIFMSPILVYSQINLKVYVPDDNFENYLENLGIGDGIQHNDSVYYLSIEMVITLNLNNLNISDLTGIENFPVLINLNCNNNQLTSLDLSQNIYLENLECSFNQITSLDLSNNTELTNIYVDDNQLSYLDLRNGFNTNIVDFYASYNPSLSCINVDNIMWSTNNWLVANYQIDSQHYFDTNCTPTNITGNNLTTKKLIYVSEILGKNTANKNNQLLLYIYDDESTEKKIIID